MIPIARLPIARSALSSASSPWPMIFTLPGSIPRSTRALARAAGCEPPGTKTNTDCVPESLARCTYAEKSGFANGMRTESTILPPASVNARLNAASASNPGA
jgi:hypothetical protein